MGLRLLLSVFLTTSFVCGHSLSGPGTPIASAQIKPNFKAAQRHYKKAERAMKVKRYLRATKSYQAAYKITGDPVLFFKLGNAFQKHGDCPKAVTYFLRYLNEGSPSDDFRKDTQSRMKECENPVVGPPQTEEAPSITPPTQTPSKQATPDDTTTPDDTLVTPEVDRGLSQALKAEAQEKTTGYNENLDTQTYAVVEEEESDDAHWQGTAAWTSVGLTLALASAGTIMGLSARSREEDIERLQSYRDSAGRPTPFGSTVSTKYNSLVEEGDRLNTMAMVTFGLAGVSASAAILFFVLDSSASDSSASQGSTGLQAIHPAIGQDSFTLHADWIF